MESVQNQENPQEDLDSPQGEHTKILAKENKTLPSRGTHVYMCALLAFGTSSASYTNPHLITPFAGKHLAFILWTVMVLHSSLPKVYLIQGLSSMSSLMTFNKRFCLDPTLPASCLSRLNMFGWVLL